MIAHSHSSLIDQYNGFFIYQLSWALLGYDAMYALYIAVPYAVVVLGIDALARWARASRRVLLAAAP